MFDAGVKVLLGLPLSYWSAWIGVLTPLLIQFPANAHPWKQQVMSQIASYLPLTQKIWTEFKATGYICPHPGYCGQLGNE